MIWAFLATIIGILSLIFYGYRGSQFGWIDLFLLIGSMFLIIPSINFWVNYFRKHED